MLVGETGETSVLLGETGETGEIGVLRSVAEECVWGMGICRLPEVEKAE